MMAATYSSDFQLKCTSPDCSVCSVTKVSHSASQKITSSEVSEPTSNEFTNPQRAVVEVTLPLDEGASQNQPLNPQPEVAEVTPQCEGATSLNYSDPQPVYTGTIPKRQQIIASMRTRTWSGPGLGDTQDVPSLRPGSSSATPSPKVGSGPRPCGPQDGSSLRLGASCFQKPPASTPVNPRVDIQRVEAPRQQPQQPSRILSFLGKTLETTLATVKDIPSSASSALIRAYNLCKIPFNAPAPELLSLLDRHDPLTAQLALTICNRLKHDASVLNPTTTLQVVLGIIQILLIAISLTILMTTQKNTTLIALQISALVTAGLQLALTFKIKSDIAKSTSLDEIVKIVYGLSDAVSNAEGSTKNEARYSDIITTLGNTFGLTPAQYNPRPDHDDLTPSALPPGSKWKTYEIVLKKKLKNLATKFPILQSYAMFGRRPPHSDLNDHLYRVFAQFRAFDDIPTEVLLKDPSNLSGNPRPFIDHLCRHIYKETNLYLFDEPWPVNDRIYEVPSTGKPAFVRQSGFDVSNGVIKGLAVLMGVICMAAGKDMKIFTKFTSNILAMPKLYNEATTIIWSFASQASAFLYHIFGFDLLQFQAKKLRVSSLIDTIRPLHAMHSENLHAIPGIKKSLTALLMEGEALLKDEPTGLDKKEEESFRKILDNFAKFISSLSDKEPTPFRRVPVGVYLHGHPASGKTHFALHYLGAKLEAERQFTKPVALDRDANGHWNEIPEGQQDYFFMDEAAAKTDDPVILDLSKMLSEGAYNPAGAFVKTQHFEPKLIVVCNNEKSLKSPSINQGAISAIASRFIEYEVVHDLYTPGTELTRDDFPRLEDYSNVKAHRITVTVDGKRCRAEQGIPLCDIYPVILAELDKKEEEYQRKMTKKIQHEATLCFTDPNTIMHPGNFPLTLGAMPLPLDFSGDLYKKMKDGSPYFFTSKHQLSHLGNFLGTSICVHSEGKATVVSRGAGKICARIVRNGPLNSDIVYFSRPLVQQQAGASDFLTWHVSGPPGCGKTTYLDPKFQDLAKTLSLPYFHLTAATTDSTFEQLKLLQTPAVVFFDDFVTANPEKWQATYDLIPKGSIVVLASNLNFKKIPCYRSLHNLQAKFTKSPYLFEVVYPNSEKYPSGWYRRLGFPGNLRLPDGTWADRTTKFTIFTKFLTDTQCDKVFQEEFLPLLFQFQALEEIKYVYSQTIPEGTFCTFSFKDFDTFYKSFESVSAIEFNLAKAITGLHSNITVTNPPSSLRGVSASLVQLIATRDEPPLHVMKRIARQTSKCYDFPVLWKFEEEKAFVLATGTTITHNLSDTSVEEHFVSYDDGVDCFPMSGESFFIANTAMQKMLEEKVTSRQHYFIQVHRDQIEKDLAMKGYKLLRYTQSDAERVLNSLSSSALSFVKHPLFIIGSVIVAVALAIVGIVKLIGYFGRKDGVSSANAQINWADEVDEEDPIRPEDRIYASATEDFIERNPEETYQDTYSGAPVASKPGKKQTKAKAALSGFLRKTTTSRPHAEVAERFFDPNFMGAAIEKVEKVKKDPVEAAAHMRHARKVASPVNPILAAPGQITVTSSDAPPCPSVRKSCRAKYQYVSTDDTNKWANCHTINRASCMVLNTTRKLKGVFIKDNIVASCSHLMTYDEFAAGQALIVEEVVNGRTLQWNAQAFFYGANNTIGQSHTELLLLRITDKRFQFKKDITSLFYSAKELEAKTGLEYTLDGSIVYEVDGMHYMPTLDINVAKALVHHYPEDDVTSPIKISQPIYAHIAKAEHSYDTFFKPGSCGTLIFNPKEQLGKPCIYGMHTLYCEAGTSISFPIYRDSLRKLCDQAVSASKQSAAQPLNLTMQFGERTFPVEISLNWQQKLAEVPSKPRTLSTAALNPDKTGIRKGGKLEFISKIPYDLVHIPNQRYKPTGVGHLAPYEPQKVPAPLVPSDLAPSAREQADSRYFVTWEGDKPELKELGPHIPSKQIKLMDEGVTEQQFNEKFSPYFGRAGELFREVFNTVAQQRRYKTDLSKEGAGKWRFLTDEEVLNGITDPQNPYRESVSAMETASGTGPSLSMCGLRTKEDMVTIDGQNADTSPRLVLKPDVKEMYEEVKKALQEGVIPFLPDQAKLKSELLKPSKVESGDTRVYISRDAMMMLFEKKVFGMLHARFHRTKGTSFSAIGMNPYTDFAIIYQDFRDKGLDKILVADAKRWDKYTLRPIMEQVFLNIKKEAPFREAEMSSNMYDAVCATILDTLFVCGDELFIVRGGMPSGTYVTTLVNILVHLYILCLMLVCKFQSKTTHWIFNWMNRNVLPKWMGDDYFLGVSQEFIRHFPAASVQEFYASCNVLLTNPQKNANGISYTSFDEFEFCSRTIKFHKLKKRTVVAFPLKLISVRADSHFSTSTTKDTLISICRTKLAEASLHGPEIYKEEAELVKRILHHIGAPGAVYIPSWAEKLEEVVPPPNQTREMQSPAVKSDA